MNCYFKMEKEHTEYADHTALARLEDAIRQRRDHVGHRVGDDKLWSYVRGCRLEMAFYLWLGGKQGGAEWIAYLIEPSSVQLLSPDIRFRDLAIDVKTRPENWIGQNIVRAQSLNPEHIYVLGAVDRYPLCRFTGWMKGELISQREIGGRADIPGHIIRDDDPDLRDCMLIKDTRYQI